MAERHYKPHVIPPEPNTWDNLLESARGKKTYSFTDQGLVEIQINVPVETIPLVEKTAIFGNSIQNLVSFLLNNNIAVPQDNILNRLFVANRDDYTALCILGRSEINSQTLGVRLPNRLCLANADEIKKKAEAMGMNYEDLLCVVGTHEIAHTLTYQEGWDESRGDGNLVPIKAFRRDGIMVSKPPVYISDARKEKKQDDISRNGLIILQEAMIQRITSQSVSTDQQDLMKEFDPYSEGSLGLESLINYLGEEPFIRATFTQSGFGDLYRSVEGKYGKGEFSRLLSVVGSPSDQSMVTRLQENGFITI